MAPLKQLHSQAGHRCRPGAPCPRPQPVARCLVHRLFRNKAAVMGMIIIAFFCFVAIFAPLIAPHNPLQMNSGKDYLPPAWVEQSQTGKSGDPDFLLGTDTLGRDVLSRVIYGARVSMIVGFVPTIIILIVGTSVGHARRLLRRAHG